jgi:uncharacterized phage protein gp47/JayE
MAGLTSAGFEIKTLQDIKTELEDAFRSRLGASIDTSQQSVIGQLIAIMADRESELWELAESIYASQYPDSASGTSLDNVASITGTTRDAPSRSTVAVTLTGNPGTLIEAGKVASVSGTGARFFLTADVTLDGGGTGAGEMESEEFGPVVANSGTLTVIETPVGGWSAVTNAVDAELGSELESDASLRVKRLEELQVAGNAAINAIRGRVLQVEGVESVTVFQNVDSVTNGDGMPPHSVEVMVEGGDDQEIIDAVFESVAAGIKTHGTESGTATDDSGNDHAIEFSRPDLQPIKVEVTLTYDADEYPADGDDQVAEAVVAAARERFLVGNDVILSALEPAVWGIAGVYDVTLIRASIDPAAFGTSNITINARDLPDFDTSLVTVISTPVVPS